MIVRILACAVVGVLLQAPVSAYAGFGDPSPNAVGVGPWNDSVSQSAARRAGWRGYGWRPGWGWRRGYGWRHCWRGYYGRLHCN